MAQRHAPHLAAEDWIPDAIARHGGTRIAQMQIADVVPLTPGRSVLQARFLSAAARVVVRMGLPAAAAPGTPDADAPDAPDGPREDVRLTETAAGLTLTVDGRVRSLDDLLVSARVDLSRWAPHRWRAGTYETTARDESGALRTIPMWKVHADFHLRIDADVPDLSTLPAAPRVESAPVDGDVMLCIPDSQHGYARDDDGRLHAIHDPRAWAIAVEVARTMQPGVIHLAGDMLDLAAWSLKFPRPRGHVDTTGPTLRALHDDIRALRQAVPGARIVYTAGNHEERIDRALVAQMSELAGLRAAGDDAPLVSIPRLLALDRLGVEYVEGYDTDAWVRGVRLTHGTKHGRPGVTVAAILADVALGGAPTVVGHTHSVEVAYQRLVDHRGERLVSAMSCGTVARIDGPIPAAQTADRRSWSQGVGVVRWSGDHVSMTAAPILPDGVCYVEGRRYAAA